MELFPVAGLLGAMAGALFGALSYVMFAAMIDGKLRAAATSEQVTPENLERRIAAGRRSVLAFNMLVFVGAGYWAGMRLGG